MSIDELRQALWNYIDCVLLDMDGTIFGKYFDDYFWGQLVPQQYGLLHNMTTEEAKGYLYPRYEGLEGTLEWTNLDFWSNELGLDIPGLTEQICHMLEINPYVVEFLELLKQSSKKVALATNAHHKTIDIKMGKTNLSKYFDCTLTSSQIGFPKEKIEFWEGAQDIFDFDKNKTLFIDDVVDNVQKAKEYGIKYLAVKTDSKSVRPDKSSLQGLVSIESFGELMPHDIANKVNNL